MDGAPLGWVFPRRPSPLDVGVAVALALSLAIPFGD